MPVDLVPSTCVSRPWGNLERSTDDESHQPSGQTELHVTDIMLRAPREASTQPAGRAFSDSSGPAASLSVPRPSACPAAQIPPSPRCGDLLRVLILHLRAAKLPGAQEGQTPSHGSSPGLAMEGGRSYAPQHKNRGTGASHRYVSIYRSTSTGEIHVQHSAKPLSKQRQHKYTAWMP